MHFLIPRFSESEPRRDVIIEEAMKPYRILHQGYIDKRALEVSILNRHPFFYTRYSRLLCCNERLTLISIEYSIYTPRVKYKVINPHRSNSTSLITAVPFTATHSFMDIDGARQYPDLFEIINIEEVVILSHRPKQQ